MTYSQDMATLTEDFPFIWPRNVKTMYSNRTRKTGLFAPYKGPEDFATTLATPVLDTLVFGAAAAGYLVASSVALASGIATLGVVLSLGIVCGCCCIPHSKVLFGTFGVAALGFASALTTAAMAILSLPYNLLTLLTRTLATLVSPITSCIASCNDVDLEDGVAPAATFS